IIRSITMRCSGPRCAGPLILVVSRLTRRGMFGWILIWIRLCSRRVGMKRVLVTGATGNVGRQVVSQLLATDCPVRAMTRNPDAAGLPLRVEVVRGALTDADPRGRCLDGVDVVFLVGTAPAGAAPAAVNRIAGHARRVVLLTAPHKTPHPFF